MPTKQRKDAVDEELDDEETPEEEDEETSEDEPGNDEPDDELATDEEVQQWLKDVTDTPEIKSIIRQTARDISRRATDRAVSEIRETLEKDMDKRFEKISKLLEDGRITESEANARAQAAAESAANAERRRSGVPPPEKEDDELDSEIKAEEAEVDAARKAVEAEQKARREEDERRRAQDEREAKIKMRELEAYRREALADEDKSKIIVEMIEIRPGMNEDSIDDLIERSREVRDRIRKQTVAEMRKQGWRSPRDLKAAESKDEEEETEEEESPRPGPPSRDAKNETLTKQRRAALRSRFGYGERAPVSHT